MQTKQVKDLAVGDVLSSGAKVIERPFDSIRCPRGKTNIGIEYPAKPGGEPFRKVQQWNKYTLVTLKTNE